MERGIWRVDNRETRVWGAGGSWPGYFPLFSPNMPPYTLSYRAFEYSIEGVWQGPVHGSRYHLDIPGLPEPVVYPYAFWDGRSGVWCVVHSPLRRRVGGLITAWTPLDSLSPEPTFPRVIRRSSWAGRLLGMGSSGFTAPVHSSVIALAHGGLPYLHCRDTFYFGPDTFIPPPDTIPYSWYVGCAPRPMYSWMRLDSIKMPGTLWDKLVWFTYGMGYSSLGPFTYLFSPVRSIMGQGWNYPIWHHRRLSEPPRPAFSALHMCSDANGRPYPCMHPLDIERSCRYSGANCEVSDRNTLLPDTVWALMRPGSVCTPLAPYRGRAILRFRTRCGSFMGFTRVRSGGRFCVGYPIGLGCGRR